jgi:hypothetical protein
MLAVFARIEPVLRKSITFDNDTAFAQHTLLLPCRRGLPPSGVGSASALTLSRTYEEMDSGWHCGRMRLLTIHSGDDHASCS